MPLHDSEPQEHVEGLADEPGLAAQPLEEKQPEPVSEQDSGSITLVRMPTFSVYAFPARTPIDAGQGSGADDFQLPEDRASDERRRLTDAQTHQLPQLETTSTAQQEIALPAWLEGSVVALFLGVTLLTQALSLFTYPAYTSDEGDVLANAWAVLQGRLTAYTFTYSHPPLGWIQLAAWAKLSGGITGFGSAINSGRVLMLGLATASSLVLYLIARQLSGSRSAALLAMVLYTCSPLSLLYRHQVLLENIGIFWLLLSLCLITNGRSRLGSVVLAAVALGIALLSKGVFLIFLPAMLWAVWLYETRFQRKFSLLTFLYITLALASIYALFALLKGELLPAGTGAGGIALHTSLLGVLLQTFQLPGPQATFRASWNTWMQADPVFLASGVLAVFLTMLGGIANRLQLLAAFFAASFCLFLLASGTVYAFAILPLLPFLALSIALALHGTLSWAARKLHMRLARVLLLFVLIGVLIPAGIQRSWASVAQNQTEAQHEALWWIGDHVPREAVVIAGSYLYADLHHPTGTGVSGDRPFVHAQIYTDATLDPAIRVGELKQDWQHIDFLVVDRSMLQTIQTDKRFILLNEALEHATLRAAFGSNADGTLVEIYQVIHR